MRFSRTPAQIPLVEKAVDDRKSDGMYILGVATDGRAIFEHSDGVVFAISNLR